MQPSPSREVVRHGLSLRSSLVVLVSKYRTLGQELADLEHTDPVVAAAAASYDEMVKRVTEDRSHAIPCTRPNCPWHTLDRCAVTKGCTRPFETTIVGWAGIAGWVFDACWPCARRIVMYGWGDYGEE